MPSTVVEHLDAPTSARDAHALGAAGDRAGEFLAGRTVWCTTALPGARRSAQMLRDRVNGAAPGVTAASLEVSADEALRHLAARVENIMAGVVPDDPGLGAAERDLYAQSVSASDELIGDAVAADDVVVVHDALSAMLARAVRERGAHAVWRFRIDARARPSRSPALEFLQRYTTGVDASLLTWLDRDRHGDVIESVTVVMPSARIVATKEFSTRFKGEAPRELAWRMALAEIVRSDRSECVGGTLRPLIVGHRLCGWRPLGPASGSAVVGRAPGRR